MSQRDLARALGVTQGTISRRWNGLRPWQLADLPEVAEVLGVSVQYLVTDPADMQNPARWITPNGAAARPRGLEPPTFWLGAADADVVNIDDYRARRAS